MKILLSLILLAFSFGRAPALTLSWDAAVNAQVYQVFSTTNLQTPVKWAPFLTTTNTSIELTNTEGIRFFYTLAFLKTNSMSVRLAWDCSSDPTVVKYNIYHGPSSGGYTNVNSTGNTNTILICDLYYDITNFFAATAEDALGLESDFSNEISYSKRNIFPVKSYLK